jgi:hypothetical protein
LRGKSNRSNQKQEPPVGPKINLTDAKKKMGLSDLKVFSGNTLKLMVIFRKFGKVTNFTGFSIVTPEVIYIFPRSVLLFYAAK